MGNALPGIMLTTSLEQTAYSTLITRLLGERLIAKFSDEFNSPGLSAAQPASQRVSEIDTMTRAR